MTGSRPAMALIVGFLMLCFGGAAQAQDLWEGKTPEQLFRLNCTACHRSPVGLASGGEKAGGLFGLDSFLAQHYTASGRSAQIIAGYLKSVDAAAARRGQRPNRNAARPRRPAADQAESAQKSDAAKKSEAKASGAKASGAKASDAKASDANASDAEKRSESDKMKAGEARAKADAPKPADDDDKAADDKSAAPKAEKPEMSERSSGKKDTAAPTAEANGEKPKPAGDNATDRKTN